MADELDLGLEEEMALEEEEMDQEGLPGEQLEPTMQPMEMAHEGPEDVAYGGPGDAAEEEPG